MSCKSTWSHHNPVRIVSGPVECLGEYVSASNLLIVTTPGMVRRGVASRATDALSPAKINVWDEVKVNPDLDDLDLVAKRYRNRGIDLVVGLGGGSAMDAAKALAYLLAPTQTLVTLDGVLRLGQKQSAARSLALVAVPTTAGTGSEVTPFATIWDHALKQKHSLSGDFIYPTIALLDPSLTMSLDLENTLYPALDSISHSLESLWNRRRTSISKTYALQSLVMSVSALPEVLDDPSSCLARTRLQEAAMLAGLAVSQTKTAIAHAISYPLTVKHSMPHGLACSFTLPGLIERYMAASALETVEARIVSDVADMLVRLRLPVHAAKFVSRAEGIAQLEHMFTPERADNCSFCVDRSFVKHLLETSLPR